MQKYRILGKKGEGTFSEVLKCQNIKDGHYYALKRMKQHYDSIEQVNNLREIQAMRRLSPNTNILELKEVIFDKKTGILSLVCELMDMNIYELIRGRRHYLPDFRVKNFMYQLCKSLDHMHRNGIFHRDVKPENILIKDETLKLADFGSCRSVYSKQPYTEYISTRWYRAPECLLTDGYYTHKMDIWSIGCVIFEIMSLHPLFPGSNEVDQISKIHDIIGTPDASVLSKMQNKARGMNFNFPPKKGKGIDKLLSHASQDCIELVYKLCAYDPDERLTTRQALKHPYFKEIRDIEKRAVGSTKMKFEQISFDEPKDRKISLNKSNTKNMTVSYKKQNLPTIAPLPNLRQQQPKRKRRTRKLNDDTHSFLPKMLPQGGSGLSVHNSSFPTSNFPSSTFPKIHSTTHSSMFPSINNSHFGRQRKQNPTYHQQPPPTKNVYGHYQLPSIDRKDGY